MMDEQLEIALKGGDFKRLLDAQFDAIKKKHGLKKVEIEVLFFLSKCGDEDTPTDISRRLNLNRGHVSQAIDSLLKKQLIDARADEADRRCIHYGVTAEAEDIIGEITEAKEQMDRQVLKGITEEELEIYQNIWKKIVSNIREIIG
jgi:DNA-binding MarR family transcriptional regulator